MRLLIAETDRSVATFLNNGFGAEHYAVDLTYDSDNAKSLIQENEYDAAILDLNLPQVDGMEVLQHFRSKRDRQSTWSSSIRNRLRSGSSKLDTARAREPGRSELTLCFQRKEFRAIKSWTLMVETVEGFLVVLPGSRIGFLSRHSRRALCSLRRKCR